MSDTYGDHYQLDKTANLQSMKDLGVLRDGRSQIPGVRLWGHRVVLAGDGIACKECEMEREVPDLLQMSNGFREVVYKMYILGEFRDTRCEPEMEQPDLTTHYDPTTTTTTTSGQNVDMYLQKGTRINVDGNHYTYSGGGIWKDERGRDVPTDYLVADYGQSALQSLPTPVADDVMTRIESARPAGVPAIGDISGPTVDMPGVDTSSSTTSTSVSTSVEDESSKETLARRLCEKVGLR